jgi:hypothetical protein
MPVFFSRCTGTYIVTGLAILELGFEEAVSVVSFISSSPGYIVNESNEQSLDY